MFFQPGTDQAAPSKQLQLALLDRLSAARPTTEILGLPHGPYTRAKQAIYGGEVSLVG